jgi:secondary thiamine-phosphate synthase enzyme
MIERGPSSADPQPPGERWGQAQHVLTVATRGAGFTDLTAELRHWLRSIGAHDGVATAFVRHTSASLVIQENADPDVQRDLASALGRLAPETAPYRHTIEGRDDMPAHIKAMLTGTSFSIPVSRGSPVLGTWQALYLVEHRTAPHRRDVVLHFMGTCAAPSGSHAAPEPP